MQDLHCRLRNLKAHPDHQGNEPSFCHVAEVSSVSSGTCSQNAPLDCICGTACLSYNDTDQICDFEVHNDHIWNDSSGLMVCALMIICRHGCLICVHSVSCEAKQKLSQTRLSAQLVAHSLLWLVQVSKDVLVRDLVRPAAVVVRDVSLIGVVNHLITDESISLSIELTMLC